MAAACFCGRPLWISSRMFRVMVFWLFPALRGMRSPVELSAFGLTRADVLFVFAAHHAAQEREQHGRARNQHLHNGLREGANDRSDEQFGPVHRHLRRPQEMQRTYCVLASPKIASPVTKLFGSCHQFKKQAMFFNHSQTHAASAHLGLLDADVAMSSTPFSA